jgi:acetoacetyl-CoA synthetase
VAIATFDQTDEGAREVKQTKVEDGLPGELVATAAFPSMPVGFRGENRFQKYFDAYFTHFKRKWPTQEQVLNLQTMYCR